MRSTYFLFSLVLWSLPAYQQETSWIRINLLGYQPSSTKVAVWCSKENIPLKSFQLIDASSGKMIFEAKAGKAFGSYGPFKQTSRLDFSGIRIEGSYYLQSGTSRSPEFRIAEDVYNGSADFCLRYMRQQQSGFNPFLKDSCHTHDGYTMYGPMPDSTHIDVSGGWHDATDYLQYVTTSANATYHLLAAYRDFPGVFSDDHTANGLEGKNGRADVLDEAKWGLDWLLKMHPTKDWMFNQLADDRDHMGFRLPKEDPFYGKGFERPVYFCTGKPQGLFKYKNRANGIASTAGKFSSAFALGYKLLKSFEKSYADTLYKRIFSAYDIGIKNPGVCQTAPGRAPYFYEEDNWVDDMELAAANLYSITGQKKYLKESLQFASREPVTPWLGRDTAKHYQWYPFINVGHYELAKQMDPKTKPGIISMYRQGIQKLWEKARHNAFYRGIPFIWCSNNLTTSFAIQCYWYRQLKNDKAFVQLEQSCFDWIFGCNPWGTSFVYGLPSGRDTPVDPHSSFTQIKNYPIDGGMVDGPVYGSIYKNLLGLTLHHPDDYEAFQSDLVVYHDDYGDYSTNEPTMDGTACLIYLLAARESDQKKKVKKKVFSIEKGAIVRGDTTKKQIALVFTGDEFGDGAEHITALLKQQKLRASFFLTGRFYRNPSFSAVIKQLKKDGHYLGPHSDLHLLYCDWINRDSLLVTKEQFSADLLNNYKAMKSFEINKADTRYFLPPYEWYNDSIANWTKELGIQLINFSKETRSAADYTTPDMPNYTGSEEILGTILNFEGKVTNGLNGFILLVHIGTHPDRTDKFYRLLGPLLEELKRRKYQFVRVDELLR